MSTTSTTTGRPAKGARSAPPSPDRRSRAGQPRRSTGSRSPARKSQAIAGWLFSLPFVVVFLLFSAWPIVWSLFMSVTDMTSRDLRTRSARIVIEANAAQGVRTYIMGESFSIACRCVERIGQSEVEIGAVLGRQAGAV